MNSKLLFFIAFLALATLACGFTVNVPSVPTPGPMVTDEISVAIPNSDETSLKISFGAGELRLSPGADDVLVQGTVTYNIPNFEPRITEDDGFVEIEQGDFKTLNVSDLRNEWDLKLGDVPELHARLSEPGEDRARFGVLHPGGFMVEC